MLIKYRHKIKIKLVNKAKQIKQAVNLEDLVTAFLVNK